MRALRDAIGVVFLMTVGLVFLVGLFLVGSVLMGDDPPDFGQDLSHKEFMSLSSREAKALRICQRDAFFEELAPALAPTPGLKRPAKSTRV